MKKLLSFIMAASMITALSACGEDKTESTAETTIETTEATDAIDNESENLDLPVLPEGVTFAQYLFEDFKTIVSENQDMTADEIAAELSANEMILFSSMSMPVEAGFLSGFSQEITGFESASMFGPAMGSIAFIGYVFELEDEETAKAFTETLASNADPRWQICVVADEMLCEAVGNKVFFVMAPISNQ